MKTLHYVILATLFTDLASALTHNRAPHKLFRKTHHGMQRIREAPDKPTSHNDPNVEKRDECAYGSWRCDGNKLQRCFGGEFSTIRTCTGETTCTSLGDRVGCRAMWEDMKDLSQQAEDVPSSSTSQWYQTDPTSTLVSTSTATRKPDDAPIAWKELSAGPTSQSTLEWKEMTTLPTSTQTSTTSQPVSTLLPTSQDTKPPTTTLDTTESAFPPAATVSTSSAQSPHYVVYSDAWLHNMPSAAELAGYNKFVLAFWLSSSGAADNAKLWQDLGSSEQRRIVQEYTKAGITLMVSAFGATDTPVSAGKDPIDTARQLADWVKRNNLQGVDIDLEDLGGMEQGKLVDWVIKFQTELRKQLPPPIVISHAPLAPWFDANKDRWGGGYIAVHNAVGDGIDWYNIQYYNQGDEQYTTCESLLFNSGTMWPTSSIFEIHEISHLPLSKLVIGKPMNPVTSANNGYMNPSGELNKCIQQARGKGWNAGVMFWEWEREIGGNAIKNSVA